MVVFINTSPPLEANTSYFPFPGAKHTHLPYFSLSRTRIARYSGTRSTKVCHGAGVGRVALKTKTKPAHTEEVPLQGFATQKVNLTNYRYKIKIRFRLNTGISGLLFLQDEH